MALKNIKESVGKLGANAAEIAKAAGGFAAEKAKDMGEKVAVVAKEQGSSLATKAQEGIENAKAAAHERKLKKLAPVTADEYYADGYDLPYLIVLVDEDERKGEELCEGAIGWLTTQNGMEVLNMYYEFAPDSGLSFYPKPQIGAAYYIDTFNTKRYIDLDRLFDVAEQDQITEMRNIAYCLGAKSCRLVSINVQQDESVASMEEEASADSPIKAIGKASFKAKASQQSTERNKLSIMFEQQFEGSDTPVRPDLKWFADDLEMLSLIDMRCGNNPNSIKKYSIKIDSSKYSALKKDQAAKIDAALKGVKIKSGAKMKQRAQSESQKAMLFEIEF